MPDIYVDESQDGFQGLWLSEGQSQEPDILIYYIHGNYLLIYINGASVKAHRRRICNGL
jgi:hypothetical protein